ncbi:MAG: hypothetical protein JWP41_1988, partial [Ramlibacter sp.]|nr:hypothetical protein [Ramlibacter sp.]
MLAAAVQPAFGPGYRMLRLVGAGRRSTAWLAADLAR